MYGGEAPSFPTNRVGEPFRGVRIGFKEGYPWRIEPPSSTLTS